jgi:hypothetical protein
MERNTLTLQKLKVPDGWIITYNNFFDIDPLKINNSTDILWNIFTEDLLQIKNEHKNIILDLGWYPEMNQNGNYCIKLIKDYNWEKPLININNNSKYIIVKIIEKILLKYRQVTTFEIVKKIIDEWDPYGLLLAGSPLDEFDGESRSISNKISKENSVNDIAIIISKVFSNSFEPFSVDECMNIAEKIKKLIMEIK